MKKIGILILLLSITFQAKAQVCEEAPEEIHQTILDLITLRWSDGSLMYRNGNRVYVSWCREHSDCEQSIRFYVNNTWELALVNDLNPKLVLAQIYHESRFNAFARSSVGARGILQLHPRSPWGRTTKFVSNRQHRERCRNRVGHCQRSVLRAGIELLSRSRERCGNDRTALNMYASGSCENGVDYSRRVLAYYEEIWN